MSTIHPVPLSSTTTPSPPPRRSNTTTLTPRGTHRLVSLPAVPRVPNVVTTSSLTGWAPQDWPDVERSWWRKVWSWIKGWGYR
ncbi:hypothetical protein E4T39_01615 [Aureobasidium subglaciale]|nr:hypothetical protein E4T39_01615 [Aureobasidium subglaciale]